MKTMIVIGNIPDIPKQTRKASKDTFSAAEIDLMETDVSASLSHDQLVSLRQKLSDTSDELDPGDCDPGTHEWTVWEKRLDKLEALIDQIDEILEPEEDWEDDDGLHS